MLRLLTLCLAAVLTMAVPASAKDKLTVYTYYRFTSVWGPGP